jgi:hypothetical protein
MARKKHSAQTGGRVLKRDVAAPNMIRRGEIVEEVVDHLRPWKDHKSRDTISAAVNKNLDTLLKFRRLQEKMFDARVYREHTKKLDQALGNVETLLLSSPGALPFSLFPPPPPMRLGETIEEIMHQHRARADPFFAELKRLRKVCARNYGLHRNYDHAKNLSADFAYSLMREHSDEKITGTKDKAYRTITSLLYEAVSGQEGADLKRACDAVIDRKRQTSD